MIHQNKDRRPDETYIYVVIKSGVPLRVYFTAFTRCWQYLRDNHGFTGKYNGVKGKEFPIHTSHNKEPYSIYKIPKQFYRRNTGNKE